MNGTIAIQRWFRGYRSRKFFDLTDIKKKKITRAELLKREIIDLLKNLKNKEDKIDLIEKRMDQEKSEAEEQRTKFEDLT